MADTPRRTPGRKAREANGPSCTVVVTLPSRRYAALAELARARGVVSVSKVIRDLLARKG